MIAQDRIQPGATVRARFPMRGRFSFDRYDLVEYSPVFLPTDVMKARAWAVVRLDDALVEVRQFDLHPDDYETNRPKSNIRVTSHTRVKGVVRRPCEAG